MKKKTKKSRGLFGKPLSLRAKATLLSACILTAAAAALSAASVFNARQSLTLQQNNFENFLITAEVLPLHSATAPPASGEGKAETGSSLTIGQEGGTSAAAPAETTSPSAENAPVSGTVSIQLTEEASPESGTLSFSVTEEGSEQLQTYTVQAVHRFRYLNYMMMAVILLLGILLTYLLLGHTLKPVKALSREIRAIDENNLDQRLENKYSSAEIKDLANSFNTMMNRISEAFAAQKRFASAAAHELKTPLACMRSNIEVLQMEENPSAGEYAEVINITKRNTDRMIALVDQLLEMTSKDTAAPPEQIELAPAAAEVIAALAPLAEKERISLSCSGSGCASVNGVLLSRALYNLIENAIKYNRPDGKIDIRIREEDGRVCIAVADTGIGLSEGDKEKIFEPFYRADPSRSRAAGGAGLGLALVKEIALASGGEIHVSDNMPCGSVFTLSLPRA